MLFSYDMLQSEGAVTIYDKMLRAAAMEFLTWRAAKPERAAKGLPLAFQNYWMTVGTTKVTPEAVGRFKRELWGKVKEITGNE
jgi:hypothetical protein